MHRHLRWWAGALVSVSAVASPWGAGRVQAQVVDVLGNMSSSQFNSLITPYIGSYQDWGNEPFVAVNPLHTNQVVVSGFAYGTNSTSFAASLWYSTNGGSSWAMKFPLQAPANGIDIPHDQTFAYDSSGNLHAAVLGGNGSGENIYHGVTSNPATSLSTTWTSGGAQINHVGTNNADQPNMALSGSHVYVAYDNFTFPTGRVQVARSDNNGVTFTAANDLAISASSPSTSFTNPGTRLATDSSGNAYSIFGQGTASLGSGVQSVSWFLNRYRVGQSGWDFAGNGIPIDVGTSHQIDGSGATWFGGINELRGNTTAVASDRTGNNIYAVYGKRDVSGLDRLYIEDFTPLAGTLVGGSSVAFSVAGQRAAMPSVAVTDNGTVFVEYDSYVGPGGNPLAVGGTFQAHLATSTDHGHTFTDQLLYSWTAPGAPNDPVFGGNRELGDYQYLEALGNTVYGTFAARGDVNSGGINDTNMIAPFYFSQAGPASTPEPATFWLLALSGGALAWRWSRRRHVAA
jgi:MYXO-CTERM domain-containing protein